MRLRKGAFTLIELLVVIAIIAILAAILFPVFAQAKLAAKKTQALSNAKQSTLGMLMYTTDNDDTFPVYGAVTGGYRFPVPHELMFPYTKNTEITGSPNSIVHNSKTYGLGVCYAPGQFRLHNQSFKPNAMIIGLATWTDTPYGVLNASAVTRPSSTILFVDTPYYLPVFLWVHGMLGSDQKYNAGSKWYEVYPLRVRVNKTYVHPSNNNCYEGYQLESRGNGPMFTPYSGKVLVSMIDGSAKAIKIAQAYSEDPEEQMWGVDITPSRQRWGFGGANDWAMKYYMRRIRNEWLHSQLR